MELMRTFVVSRVPPVIPYFGSGENKLQPVSVKDVAFCLVECLRREATIGKTFELGGPRAYSWKEMYEVCRRLIPGAKAWKPKVSLPVAPAKIIANTVMKHNTRTSLLVLDWRCVDCIGRRIVAGRWRL